MIAIQEATVNEHELLATLIRAAFQDVAERFSLTMENCPKHPSNCTREWVETDYKRGVRYHILTESDIPVGCVSVEFPDDRVCYLGRLSVLPEKRGRHYGKKLVAHVVDMAVSCGVKEISIGIIHEQTELKEWYQALGFVETATKRFSHLPFTIGMMAYDIGD